MRLRAISTLLCLFACGPQVPADDGTAGASSSEDTGALDTSTSNAPTGPDGSGSGDVGEDEDVGDDKIDLPPDDDPVADRLDVLVVVDNSAHTADLQIAMGEAMGAFVERLSENARDVQVMFTTTDMGNPLCSPFQPLDYAPALGAPTTTGCNARIGHFTGLGSNPDVRADACTSLCPIDIAPSDPFVAFDTMTGETNVGPFDAVDDALACLLPQGISGCGYESPLEAMLQALDPDAEWNSGARPFLREGADLAIVIVTDESDCSVEDYSVMDDDAYFEVNPDNGGRQASSALCWNAGVQCTGPDADGVYTGCMSVADGPLRPVARYADTLVGLSASGKRVSMLAVVGVPGVVRDFQESDVLPSELTDGTNAADLQFDFGIGPTCVRADELEIRAIPNPRVLEVCAAVDGCCTASACDEHEGGLSCLVEVASQ